jgi:hypothetical protein
MASLYHDFVLKIKKEKKIDIYRHRSEYFIPKIQAFILLILLNIAKNRTKTLQIHFYGNGLEEISFSLLFKALQD